MEETVVAPATPSGRGGVSIVRISGPEASLIGVSLCGELPQPWSFKPCSILSVGGGVLDSGLVVFLLPLNPILAKMLLKSIVMVTL